MLCDLRASDYKEWDALCETSNEEYKTMMHFHNPRAAIISHTEEERKENDAGSLTVAATLIHEEKEKKTRKSEDHIKN